MVNKFNQTVKPTRLIMREIKDKTEDKILDAAHEVFLRKGMDGARMQEIADEAGINKALLHYYFRSKEKLFEAIFATVLKKAFPNILKFLASDLTLEQKVDLFIESYIDLLQKNPYLPMFILKEINRNPESLADIIRSKVEDPEQLFETIGNELRNNDIFEVDPRHLLVNIIALSVFPFAARPLVQQVMFGNDKKAYQQFLSERKQVVKQFIHRSISKP